MHILRFMQSTPRGMNLRVKRQIAGTIQAVEHQYN
jgi:hypothetical protein